MTPLWTISTSSISTPSSSTEVLSAGMEPGVRPPTSAWCPRAAVQKAGASSSSDRNTGWITVMSGRWVPPL